jgi:membrane associated rhomboid family serine protease
MTPVVRGLMIAIGAAFIIQLSLTRFGGLSPQRVFDIFGFSPEAFLSGQIWQVLTYPFLHGDPFHLLINIMMLYLLGTELEQRWGARRFLRYYAICGVGGALLHTLIWAMLLPIAPGDAALLGLRPIVGASGAVYGLLMAFGVLNANAIILAFFVVPMKAKQFVAFLIGFEVLFAVFYSDRGVAHLVHLGGMAAGYILLKMQGPDLRGGGGGLFRRRGKMSRDEVRQRLRVVSNQPEKGTKGMPITWN